MTSEREYRGLTWDHPRGYLALERAAELAREQGLPLYWSRQPLEGFESHPIADLTAKYDLIVLDHPHLGDAVAGNCLEPLESLFGDADIAQWKAQSIGNSFSSYRYAGKHWALPLDAASQVAAARTDLIDGPIPKTWEEVLVFARNQRVCLSLAGPHAVLSLFSLAAAHGNAPGAKNPGELFASDGTAERSWEILLELFSLSYKGWLDQNPIGILERLARNSEAVYCPLVFGYVNYATASAERAAVTFADVPRGPSGLLGATLGGTGLAVCRGTVVSDELRDHLRSLLSLPTQREFIPFAEGQPSARAAWTDGQVNSACGDFFANTKATLEAAIVRPRHAGFIAFQTAAAHAVRDGLLAGEKAAIILKLLQSLYQESLPHNAEI